MVDDDDVEMWIQHSHHHIQSLHHGRDRSPTPNIFCSCVGISRYAVCTAYVCMNMRCRYFVFACIHGWLLLPDVRSSGEWPLLFCREYLFLVGSSMCQQESGTAIGTQHPSYIGKTVHLGEWDMKCILEHVLTQRLCMCFCALHTYRAKWRANVLNGA